MWKIYLAMLLFVASIAVVWALGIKSEKKE